MLKNTVLIIPSLNPDEKLMATVKGMLDIGFEKILIVNDGSSKEHLKYFPADSNSIKVIHYADNRGKGYALKTAFKYVIDNYTDAFGVITVDGDGQHTPEDTLKCVKALYENPEKAILGCRDFEAPDVPRRSRMGNKITRTVFKTLCGIKVTDTQTGLRAFPFSMLPLLLSIKGDRFEYETNVLLKLNSCRIDFYEVLIETVYIEENSSSHFRPFVDSVRIYKFILAFFLSSIISFLADISVFYALSLILGKVLGGWSVIACTVIARAISSVLNYTLNRRHVFDGESSKIKSFIRYYMLALMIMAISALSVTCFSALLSSAPIIQALIKTVVDSLLFLLSYRIQRGWVFTDNKSKHEKKKLSAKSIIGRSLLSVFTALLMVIVTVVSACLMICYGPSESLKNMTVIMAMEASATKWIPGLFMPDAEVERIVKQSEAVNLETVDIDTLEQNTADFNENDEGIKLIFLNKPKFKAYVLLVKDPKRISVGVSSENFANATEGVGIFDIAEKYGCVAAINGGEFLDIGGMGKGAAPIGITYSGGEAVWNDGAKRTFIGFDNNDKLVCVEGLTKEKAESLGIRDGVCFKTGNTLIEQLGEDIKIYRANAGIGPAQRTAIGQSADGTVIMLVTDGRSTDSIGATRNDVIDIMLSYGAVSAGMLDGGSSAMMYYKDFANKLGVDTTHYDDYQKLGMVNRYKAFTKPRSIPTYFIVK